MPSTKHICRTIAISKRDCQRNYMHNCHMGPLKKKKKSLFVQYKSFFFWLISIAGWIAFCVLALFYHSLYDGVVFRDIRNLFF